jgi:hypothetical protein
VALYKAERDGNAIRILPLQQIVRRRNLATEEAMLSEKLPIGYVAWRYSEVHTLRLLARLNPGTAHGTMTACFANATVPRRGQQLQY